MLVWSSAAHLICATNTAGQRRSNKAIGELCVACRFVTCFVTVFATVIAITKDLPDVEGDRKYNIDTLATRLGVRTIAFAGKHPSILVCPVDLTAGIPAPLSMLSGCCCALRARHLLNVPAFTSDNHAHQHENCCAMHIVRNAGTHTSALYILELTLKITMRWFAGSGLLLANYMAAMVLAIRMPGSFRAPVMLGGHAILAFALIGQILKLESEKYTDPAIQAFYRFIWNLFYSEYLILPFL